MSLGRWCGRSQGSCGSGNRPHHDRPAHQREELPNHSQGCSKIQGGIERDPFCRNGFYLLVRCPGGPNGDAHDVNVARRPPPVHRMSWTRPVHRGAGDGSVQLSTAAGGRSAVETVESGRVTERDFAVGFDRFAERHVSVGPLTEKDARVLTTQLVRLMRASRQ